MTTDEARPSRRRYRSPLREQQAVQTRSAVIAAGIRLFGEKGWAGTGMRDVAAAAGVAIETVYASFRSKRELLTACIDRAVVADDEPVPLADRSSFLALGHGTRVQRAAAAAALAGRSETPDTCDPIIDVMTLSRRTGYAVGTPKGPLQPTGSRLRQKMMANNC